MTDSPAPVNSIIHYTLANHTDRLVFTDPCPGAFAEQLQPDDSWLRVWSTLTWDECAASFIAPGELHPGATLTSRSGPTFAEPGMYRIGLLVTQNLTSWPAKPVYSNVFEVR